MPEQPYDEADRSRMDCRYCSLQASDQKVVFSDDLVRFVQDRRYQGALKHSGVIIPVAHRATVFDLTEGEVAATFRLLRRVKAGRAGTFGKTALAFFLSGL
jgi:hypothetical protein